MKGITSSLVHRGPLYGRCRAAVVATAVVLTTGCSTYATQTYGYLAEAQVAINAARDAGADARATHFFSEAVLRLRDAKQLMSADRFEAAQRAAEDAHSLAELAEIQARHDASQQQLELLQKDIGRIETSWRPEEGL